MRKQKYISHLLNYRYRNRAVVDECPVATLESEANKMKINGKRFIKEAHFTSWSFRRMLIVMMILMVMITAHIPLAGVYACDEPGSYADSDNPDHFMDHYFMDSRDFGSSGKMTGNIELIPVFINNGESTWSDEEIDRFIKAMYDDSAYLEQCASAWGAKLHFSVSYFEATVPSGHDDDWYDYLMDNYFYNKDHHMETLQKYYESEGGYDDTPLLFVFNTEGRCYSYEGTVSNGYRDEFSVFFAKSMGMELSITHELLHLYGAHDYYFPESLKEIANKYFPSSSMMNGGREVDELTAYFIGWTDELTQDSTDFLCDTYSLDY